MVQRFLSKGWVEEARRKVQASDALTRLLADVDAALVSIVKEAPGGETLYFYQRFSAGKLEQMEVGADPALGERPALLKTRTTYAALSEINQGKISLVAAVMNGKVKVEGNLSQAMRLAPAFAKFYEIVRGVETEY